MWTEERCRGCRYENACDFKTCRIEHEKKIREDTINDFAWHMKLLCRGVPDAEKYVDSIADMMKNK